MELSAGPDRSTRLCVGEGQRSERSVEASGVRGRRSMEPRRARRRTRGPCRGSRASSARSADLVCSSPTWEEIESSIEGCRRCEARPSTRGDDQEEDESGTCDSRPGEEVPLRAAAARPLLAAPFRRRHQRRRLAIRSSTINPTLPLLFRSAPARTRPTRRQRSPPALCTSHPSPPTSPTSPPPTAPLATHLQPTSTLPPHQPTSHPPFS